MLQPGTCQTIAKAYIVWHFWTLWLKIEILQTPSLGDDETFIPAAAIGFDAGRFIRPLISGYLAQSTGEVSDLR